MTYGSCSSNFLPRQVAPADTVWTTTSTACEGTLSANTPGLGARCRVLLSSVVVRRPPCDRLSDTPVTFVTLLSAGFPECRRKACCGRFPGQGNRRTGGVGWGGGESGPWSWSFGSLLHVSLCSHNFEQGPAGPTSLVAPRPCLFLSCCTMHPRKTGGYVGFSTFLRDVEAFSRRIITKPEEWKDAQGEAQSNYRHNEGTTIGCGGHLGSEMGFG